MSERVLVVGEGGREHALGWKISQSPRVSYVEYVSASHDVEELLKLASDFKADLTVVGPESVLEKGIVDAFLENKLPIFGPTKEASKLETDKSWAIEFMQRHNIPCPESVISTNFFEASAFIDYMKWEHVVVKASGLASGKGVILPETKLEAKNAIYRVMKDKEFDSGKKVILQERLEGKEVSMLAITDGTNIVPLLPAQDHKRINDEDKGPNTGGMGAFAPSLTDNNILSQIYQTILKPTIEGMKEEETPFKGVLYAGIMLTKDGPKVLEFNVRFGDPETQPLMMLLSSDLYPTLKSSVEGKLKPNNLKFRSGSSVCVVLSAKGYPDIYTKGDVVYGVNKTIDKDIQIFQSGTQYKNGQLITNGGRVLGITAVGENLSAARNKVYKVIGPEGIHFYGMHYRNDIGKE